MPRQNPINAPQFHGETIGRFSPKDLPQFQEHPDRTLHAGHLYLLPPLDHTAEYTAPTTKADRALYMIVQSLQKGPIGLDAYQESRDMLDWVMNGPQRIPASSTNRISSPELSATALETSYFVLVQNFADTLTQLLHPAKDFGKRALWYSGVRTTAHPNQTEHFAAPLEGFTVTSKDRLPHFSAIVKVKNRVGLFPASLAQDNPPVYTASTLPGLSYFRRRIIPKKDTRIT